MDPRRSCTLARPLGLALACAAVAAAEARAQGAVEVTASVLNVRSGPSTGQAALGQAQRGQVYPVLARSGEWVRLQFGEGAGWAHGDYLRASAEPVLVVTAGTLNVRAGPDARYRDLGDLGQGTRVVPRAAQGPWRRIDFQGREAWVHGDHLAPAGGAPTPTPPPAPSPSRPRSAAGFIQLAAAGEGFSCYSVPARRWGTPTMIYGIERVARRWARSRPGGPRMGIGDVSAMNGGKISGHASHQKGVDVDVRPVRTSGEGGVTRFDAAYSRAGTRALIGLFQDELNIVYVFFNDAAIAGTTRWPNHDNHFHVRIR